jgi:HEAT repeat protein
MKDTASANILMSVLTRFEDPSLKIDAIVALGKIGEPRCGPILKALRNDPDGGVAFTAAEIYRSLFGEDDKHDEPAILPEAPVGDDTVPERRLKR